MTSLLDRFCSLRIAYQKNYTSSCDQGYHSTPQDLVYFEPQYKIKTGPQSASRTADGGDSIQKACHMPAVFMRLNHEPHRIR